MSNLPESRPNPFQRRYFAWAQPRYARMRCPLGAEAERIDRWLYSGAGLRAWIGLVAAIAVTAVGLVFGGLSWLQAIAAALVAWLFIAFVTLSAWMRPERYTASRLPVVLVGGLVLAYVGALGGFLGSSLMRHGRLDFAALPTALAGGLARATPLLVLLIATVVLLSWGVASIRRFRAEKEVAWLRLAQERDAAARLLTEARLTLLQRQIQPHFIFNTLAAVQHWVDQGDPRAGPMLHALTAFLRGSTDTLTLDRTTLAVEVETVRHYLAIMTARLGDRLRSVVTVEPATATRMVPPGLLLTLVENAIEHGVSPALRGGTIDVSSHEDGDGWTLVVQNDGAALAPDWQDGVGLANCRERLVRLLGDRATLDLASIDARTVATVRAHAGASA